MGESGKVYALNVDKKALDIMEKKARKEKLKNITRIGSSRGVEVSV